MRVTLRIGVIAGVICLVIGFAQPVVASPGDLDPTFSGDGKVRMDITSGWDAAFAVAIQPDGKIVTAGVSDGEGGNPKLAVVRLRSNGKFDNTFSEDGKRRVDITSGWDAAFAVAIQPDGKIVTAGEGGTTNSQFAIVRLNQNGSMDKSFSDDGQRRVDLSSDSDRGYAVAIQPDGKIVVAGRAGEYESMFGLLRLNPDGTIDKTFSSDGKVTTDFTASGPEGPGSDGAFDLAIQSDGKIVTAGVAGPGWWNSTFALARYTTDGALDATFDGDGKSTLDYFSMQMEAHGVVVQPDGKIVAAGEADGTFALARYLTNGSLDPTFGTEGFLTTDFGAKHGYVRANDVALQLDGRIVAAGGAQCRPPEGECDPSQNPMFAVARYESDGALDLTFSGNGRVTTDFVKADCWASDEAAGVAIQADGRIVAAGWTNPDSRFAVVRYLAE
jgi:uncharacterized delta-60 repeat protein